MSVPNCYSVQLKRDGSLKIHPHVIPKLCDFFNGTKSIYFGPHWLSLYGQKQFYNILQNILFWRKWL